MPTNTKLFLWLALFFLFFSVVYPTWIYLAGSPIEWVGTLAIPLTMIMFLLLGGFESKDKNDRGNEPYDADDADDDAVARAEDHRRKLVAEKHLHGVAL